MANSITNKGDIEVLAGRTRRTGNSTKTKLLVEKETGEVQKELDWISPKKALLEVMNKYMKQSAVGRYKGQWYKTRKELMEMRADVRTNALSRMADSPLSAILGGSASFMESGLKALDIATALGKTAWAPVSAHGKSIKRGNEASATVKKDTVFGNKQRGENRSGK